MTVSLRQLLGRSAPLLTLDTSGLAAEAAVFTGLEGQGAGSREGAPFCVARVEGEASCGLPAAVEAALAQAGLRVRDLRAVAFCAGPGSTLGVRVAAASVRAWRALHPALELYAFLSLPLLARAHPEFTVIADARRDSWHVARACASSPIERLSSAELGALAAGPEQRLGTPLGFRRWSALPDGLGLTELPWSAARLLASQLEAECFTPAPEPEAWQSEAPSYARWTPAIHRAPSPP